MHISAPNLCICVKMSFIDNIAIFVCSHRQDVDSTLLSKYFRGGRHRAVLCFKAS